MSRLPFARGDAMSAADTTGIWLFSYGTLRQREVQLAIFGRELQGQPDVLLGYALSRLDIVDPAVIAASGSAIHTMTRRTDNPRDEVPGVVFRVTPADLAAADAYEVADVKRVTARLASGIEAFLYVDARSS
jgi:gamma-glutamylcyclotransferase (GGCT)/AIG2-like uncharacterized protein YtfP